MTLFYRPLSNQLRRNPPWAAGAGHRLVGYAALVFLGGSASIALRR
jgi:hypothetical protein